MAMVDRYKKAGGFIQLLQVIETCGPKKREQFMKIIREETPKWAEAIDAKMITFEKILSWSPEAIMEINANLNILTFGTALKALPEEQFQKFAEKLGPIEGRKFEKVYQEGTPSPSEISSCIVKLLNETRLMLVSNKLKYEKVDPLLDIPEDFEHHLEKGVIKLVKTEGGVSTATGIAVAANAGVIVSPQSTGNMLGNPNEVDSLRRKIVELNQQVQLLKKDNLFMKDKLDKIKKIA